MKLFSMTSLVAFNIGNATAVDVEMGIRVLDESFRISVIIGGVFVTFLAVMVFFLHVGLLVTEFRKVKR